MNQQNQQNQQNQMLRDPFHTDYRDLLMNPESVNPEVVYYSACHLSLPQSPRFV